MTSTAPPVSAAAEQEHQHNDNENQFHGNSSLMAMALAKTPQPKQQPTRTDAVRAAKARIMRLNSLRKQRDAQKG
jgi:hypothetical protein